ncbi:hypothetical protein CHLRE_01g051250v5 [Chlamydomonas reinhardtii]|uniref:Dynein 18 kDa light chain, flagellar outer arm n=2 Tax=Chlamydomonas reinhardtii TaxID=3055 RepID=DYL3_CHLRE|nr:uncharacterized protein CHLRE_01g051250v5 [Chlamydomonas reinhardtii]Q39584.1 RecName: Full=Dynein 18 kDa light chain, flagellar outer arm [Chlamydomonas reinhardtii]7KZM_G Chain G, Dynein 18 kDa light chain, flagellar outer arm [Chlamydomonas reinhardtii]7KZN_G Chain G, Dynein 18 kDa light chain, flagellar outer arm [Chlamydomonas reinhardtii]8GLV_BC Chain BC, Dynein 18 kDa light chain, flagellar outer arm [Chlamydomonas reinhardtii]8GLV_BD Chain BD, Dynein 18 kDa light chain, flagellar ou|eukprot:XP_001690249.1 flagellar outer dynein arm 18 kDa light chain LC4 [Chlamydomonas reinhardtii]
MAAKVDIFAANLPNLTDEEMDMCRKAFAMFDKDGSGTIDTKELRTALSALGQNPTEEDMFVMISQVDQDGSRCIEFKEFVRVIQINKQMSAKDADEADTLDAFVALGGNLDKTGRILVDKLRSICEEFELTVNVDRLVKDADRDLNGFLSYDEFRALLS